MSYVFKKQVNVQNESLKKNFRGLCKLIACKPMKKCAMKMKKQGKKKKRYVHKTLLIVYGACVEKWYDRLQRISG